MPPAPWRTCVPKGEADYPYADLCRTPPKVSGKHTAAADKRLADGPQAIRRRPGRRRFDYLNGLSAMKKVGGGPGPATRKTEAGSGAMRILFHTGEITITATRQVAQVAPATGGRQFKVYHYLEYAAAQARLRGTAW